MTTAIARASTSADQARSDTASGDRGSRGDASSAGRRWTGWHAGLALLALFSAFLTLWMLSSGAYSDYYASIALSMSQNWSNFFFGAMDPAGTVSLDKIPGSFWIPALFVKAFGFSVWSIIVPHALAMIAAVLVVAVTAKRISGPTAGLVAGAVVATTPILVAVSRSNQPESFFVLMLALVAWAGTNAVMRISAGWLITTGVFIAVAFQTYMLEAWAVWPALGLAYLFAGERGRWRRVGELAVAGVISLALSLTWITIVALVPATSRPWVGSTLSDNPFEMVFGYNGLGRFGAATQSEEYLSFTPPFSGEPGVVRLFTPALAGQIGWLIPTAILAIGVLIALRTSRSLTMFVGGWLITFLAMFSIVAGMHQFYTAALAVPFALLIGIAFGTARVCDVLWPQIALVAAASTTAILVALQYADYLLWAAIAQAVAAGVAIVLLCARRVRRTAAVACVAVVGMLLAPAAWSVDVMNHPNAMNPVAGDGASPPGIRSLSTGNLPSGSADVLAHVQPLAGDAQYTLAVFGAQEAAGYIIASGGASVMPIGGFNGRDAAPLLARFEELVAAGDVPFVLVGQSGAVGSIGGAAATGSTGTQIRAWVEQNCSLVSDESLASRGLYSCGPS